MSLAILTCHYNPCGYVQLRRNFLRFLRQLGAEGVPVFVAELAYDNEPWVLDEGPRVLRLRTTRANILWHKENLLNCLERIVPEEFDRLAWFDADVWFQNLDWYGATVRLLETRAVVQPFEEVIWAGEDGRPEKVRKSAAAFGVLDGGAAWWGFAWAARRGLWREAGGLYERAIVGGGDLVNAGAWLPGVEGVIADMRYTDAAPTVARLRDWAGANGGCGFIEGTLWHEWHGSEANRNYVERNRIIEAFAVGTELLLRPEDGLLEFMPSVSEGFRGRVRSYFEGRNEDGKAHSENPWMHDDELRVLAELLKPGDAVLEFGSGGSTLWLASRVREVHSIEHDKEWAATIIRRSPENVTVHWRRGEFPNRGHDPAALGQFETYLRVPDQIGQVFDACLIDGRARIQSARAVARWLRPGGYLFFHDWFPRERYTQRFGELAPFYIFREDLSVRHTPQTLAVFERIGETRDEPGLGGGGRAR